MADPSFEETVLADLRREADAVAKLAADEHAFNTAYEAFRSADRDAFRAALRRLKLLPFCDLICEWIRIKECVFRCLELCGPPKPAEKPPDPRVVAEAIARVTADEKLVGELAAIVEKPDRDAFQRFVETHELGPFCHFFCHWVCLVRYRLVCRWVCGAQVAERPHLATELATAGGALARLLENKEAFEASIAASEAGDPDKLRAVLEQAELLPFCRWICEWFCSWRCVWLCLRVCGQFPLPVIADELKEAFAFARATQSLAHRPAELERLNTAVAAGAPEGFAKLVEELKLQRFCIQLCHWLCFLRCRRFCVRVCPPLQCAITDPTGCTQEEPDPVAGNLFVRVHGTASGGDFGHYTLEIQRDGDPPIAGVVSYPGGGATGTVPVLSGELGRIDTTSLSDGAYTITVTVFPATPGATKVCQKTFNLLKVAVYITRVAGIAANPNCFDENAELISSAQIRSFGGALHIDGSAYVYDCAGRKIERYEIRQARVTAPGPGPGQPPNDTPVPAAWPTANQVHTPLVYDPSKYWPWTRVGEIPANLINDWGTIHIGPSPGGMDYPILVPSSWDSRGATGNPGGGRYALLLIVEDTAGHRYFDLQRIWVDNWPVLCQMVKFQKPAAGGGWDDIPPCTDIMLSWGKLRIIGLAWDALIDSDPAWPTTSPNDNFDQYSLAYRKEFVGFASGIPITPTVDHPALASNRRVPDTLTPTPTVADADLLAEWDLATLDAGPAPAGGCEAPLPPGQENELYRGCACTYTLSLGVSDTTVTETVFDFGLHHPSTSEPIKIVNDL
jgi:hypothetical protein